MLSVLDVRQHHEYRFPFERIGAEHFTYVTETDIAGKYLDQLKRKSKFVTIDTEHYNFAKRNYQSCSVPLKTKIWDVCGPYVSLVQMGSIDRTFVFDIPAMGALPEPMRDLLESSDVVKVVFDHRAEAQALMNSFDCEMKSVLDLQPIFKSLDVVPILNGFTINPPPVSCSLSNTVHCHLGAVMDGTSRTKSWLKDPLPHSMLQYAADDAAVLVQLIEYLASASEITENRANRFPRVNPNVLGTFVRELQRQRPSQVSPKKYRQCGSFPVERLRAIRSNSVSRVLGPRNAHFLYWYAD